MGAPASICATLEATISPPPSPFPDSSLLTPSPCPSSFLRYFGLPSPFAAFFRISVYTLSSSPEGFGSASAFPAPRLRGAAPPRPQPPIVYNSSGGPQGRRRGGRSRRRPEDGRAHAGGETTERVWRSGAESRAQKKQAEKERGREKERERKKEGRRRGGEMIRDSGGRREGEEEGGSEGGTERSARRSASWAAVHRFKKGVWMRVLCTPS